MVCGRSEVIARIGLAATLILGGPASIACQAKRSRSPTVPAAGAPLPRVEWAGCAVVRAGPRCELGTDRHVHLWTSAPDAPSWTFTADGKALSHESPMAMQEGWAISVEVPRGTRELAAVGHRDADDVIWWSLAVGEARLFPNIDALVKAGKGGDPNAAKKLQELTRSEDLAIRGPAEAGYARVMLAQGKMDEAEAAFHRALAADRNEQRLSDEMREGSALMWGLVAVRQRFADARAVLASLAGARDGYPEGQAWYAQNEGLLAAETGDLRDALAGYRKAFRVFERLANTVPANASAEDLARILELEGRSEDALSVLDRLPVPDDLCARATLMMNRAAALTSVETRNARFDTTRVLTALLDERRATDACGNPHGRWRAVYHTFLHWLAISDQARLDDVVDRMQALPPPRDPLDQIWQGRILGRWSLERHRASDALAAFDKAATLAHAAGLADQRFEAEVGTGEALLALGRRRAGVDRLRTAQVIQRELSANIPLTEGRGEFLNSTDRGVRHLVDALVADGALREGMAVARVARATEVRQATRLDNLRQLSAEQRRRLDEALERHARLRRQIELEAMQDWKLPGALLARARADRSIRADEARAALDEAFRFTADRPGEGPHSFAAPEPNVVEIVIFPGAKQWIAFVRTRTTLDARRFGAEALTSNASAATVLESLSANIAPALRVVVLASGIADRLDWHAVAWRGQPLISQREVVYSLDLPGSSEEPANQKPTSRVLIMTNPSGDLASATSEGDMVTRAFHGSSVDRFDRATATRDALLGALPNADLFHYAGHADSGEAGGRERLLLAGGAHTDIGDLLGLARIPGLVVLGACRAAAARAPFSSGAPVSMLGLAQAFLVSGARAVVAPTGEVDDAEARDFMATFYGVVASRGLAALTEAFRRAAVEAAGKTSASFRLIVR